MYYFFDQILPVVLLDNSFQQDVHLIPDRDFATGYNRFGLDFVVRRRLQPRPNTAPFCLIDLTMHCMDYYTLNYYLKSDLRGWHVKGHFVGKVDFDFVAV